MNLDSLFTAIEKSLGINRMATVVAMGGFIVMAMTIGLMQLADDDTLSFWQLLAALVVVMFIMAILSALPLLVRRLLGWVLAACLTFVAITATAQAVTGNGFKSLAPVHCIVSLFTGSTCPHTPVDASLAPLAGAAFAGTPEVEHLILAQGTAALPGQADARVFIQFAGFKRESVVELASALTGAGWVVEGADRGGERISAAAGINELRYFNPADAALALALAEATAAATGQAAPELRDLSETKYGQTAKGLLELWISQ